MRGSPAFRRSCKLVSVAGVVLLSAGCTLVSPGCRNREVKDAIEQEARGSIDFWLTMSKQRPLPSGMSVRLVEPIEVSRQDSTRTCSAKVAVGGNGKQLEVPIDYEVIAGDDGQAFYRWNKDEFGKTYIAMGVWSLSQNILQQPADKDATESGGVRVPRQDASGSPPQTSNKLDENKPDEASDKLAFARWHDEVVETVNAQSINVRIEGSGSVFLSFEISATGELSDAKILRSSGSASLDKAALQMVEKARRVSTPPDRRATSFSMKLAFL